ncbi:DUF1542 domain-containing protein [Erysipelothrix rhusiopathiae]|nr:DUF1542 domain-containing protein [Erysipelothrix rhusiopathiae]
MKKNNFVNKIMSTALVFVLLVSSVALNQSYTISAQENEELFPFRGNKLQNPYIRYTGTDKTIPSWKIAYTNNIYSGESTGTISNKISNNYRDVGKPNFLVGEKNDSESSVFRSKSMREDGATTAENAAFLLLGQTIQLQSGFEYYFRAELKSPKGSNNGVLNIYPGTATSGKGGLAAETFNVTNKLQIVSLPFTPTGDGKVTVSLRHFANKDKNTNLEIHRMGFFLKDDYLIQEEAHALFNDSDFTELIGSDTSEIQKNIDAIRAKITASGNPYASDVKGYVNELLDKAQALLDQAKKIERDINATYENFEDRVLKGDVTQDTIDELKNRINSVASPGLNEKLTNDLKELERVYELQELKPVLKQELESKADDAIKKIENLQNVSEDEKNEKIAAIKKELENGKIAIDGAKKREDAISGKDTSSLNIEKIVNEISLVDQKNNSKSDLDKKAEDAKKEIDKLPNLTEEEKQTAKEAIDQKTKEGKDAIDQATTPKDVEEAKNTTDTTVKEVVDQSTLQDAKNKAKKELEAKAEETNQAIDALPGLSQEVKDKAKSDIDDVLKKGLENIDSKNTESDIDAVVNESKTEMDEIKDRLVNENKDAIESLINDKKASLAEEAKKAKETIDNLENLSQDEKDAAKKSIDQAVNDAGKEFDQAKTPQDIDAVYNKGKNDIADIVVKAELDDAKTKAIEDLKAKAEAVRTQIERKPALSDQQRKAANDEINKTLAEAIKRIEDTAIITEIPNNLKLGMDELDAIESKYEAINTGNLDKLKEDSKSDLDKKAEDAKKEIDKLPNLTEEEKQTAKEAIDQKTKEGKDAIDQATTPKEIDKVIDATDKGNNKIIDESTLLDTKNKAKSDLDKKAEDAKKEIDKLPNLTEEEKQTAKEAIDQKTKEGKDAIDQATTPKDVEEAKNTTDTSVKEVVDQSTLQDAKNKAKKELEAKAEETKQAIDALPGLSQEVKDKAKSDIDDVLKKGLENIDSKNTESDIDAVVNESKTEMDEIKDRLVNENKDAIESLINDKKASLAEEAKKAKETIDNLENLSQDEKDAAKKSIDQAVNDAGKEFEQAKTPQDIDAVYNKGKNDIADIVVKAELDDAKTKAIEDLKAKAETVRTQIERKPALSDQQRKAANDEINKTLAEAIKRIKDTAIITEIPDNLKLGMDELDAIESKYEAINTGNLGKLKEDSKSDLDKKAEDAKKEIDKLPNLTEEEKQTAKEAIDQKTKEGKDAIDQATTPKDVEEAKNTTDTSVKEVVDQSTLQDAKNKAKKELEAKAEETKQAIDALPGLSQEVKDKAKSDIDDVLKKGLENIDSKNTESDIDAVVNESKTEMDEIKDRLVNENKDAIESLINDKKASLAEEAKKAKETIDNLENLSQDEKDAAKKSIDQAVNDAGKEFEQAKTPQDIDAVYNKGKNDIADIVVKAELDDAKTKAIEDLKAKAEAVRTQIERKPALSDQQRKAANDEINKTLAEAIKRIEDTAIITEIPDNLKLGMDELDAIESKYEAINTGNLDKLKEDSKSDLDKKAEDAKKEIDKLPNLTEEEKQTAKEAIDQKTKEGKDAIDQATTPKEIDKVIDATDKGNNKIIDESTLLDTKNKAKSDLDKKAEDAKKEIDKLPNLTEEEKQTAKEAIDQKTKEGKDAIDQATTPKDVEEAKNTTDTSVKEVVDQSTLQDAKNKAKKELEAKAEETKQAIDALPGLSQEEKLKAKAEVDKVLKEGLNSIELGQTVQEINKALNRSIKELEQIIKKLTKFAPILPNAGITSSKVVLYGILTSLVGMLFFVIQIMKNRYNH